MKALRHICRSVLKGFRTLSESDREDLFQEAWERLQPAFHAGRPNDPSNSAIAAYVRVTARSRALNRLRARRGGPSGEDWLGTVQAPGLNPEELAMLKEATETLQTWSPVDRLIFIRKNQGARTIEIARELKDPPYQKAMTAVAIDLRFHKIGKRLREQ
jgi:DNA-directed RNA polymerase specialized sigma24 family protein